MLQDSKKCDKAVMTCYSRTKFIPECFMTQEMCDKAVNRCFLYLIPNWFLKILFLIVYCPDIELKEYAMKLWMIL